MYVAGTYDTGISTIEKWVFVYGLSSVPAVQKSVLYQGQSIGYVASMTEAPSGQFLFVVTDSPTKVYRVSTTGLTPPAMVYDQATISQLRVRP